MDNHVISYLLYFLVTAPQAFHVFVSQLAAHKEPKDMAIFLGISVVLIPVSMFLYAWLTPEIMSLAIEGGGFGHSSPLSCRFFLVVLIIVSSYFRNPNAPSR